jgi:hypothetical protein
MSDNNTVDSMDEKILSNFLYYQYFELYLQQNLDILAKHNTALKIRQEVAIPHNKIRNLIFNDGLNFYSGF